MKKVQKMNGIQKFVSMFVMITILVCGLTACQKTDNINTGATDVMRGSYMGEITAIDGNVLTVNVMGGGMTRPEKFDGETFDGELPEGFKPNEMPEGFEAGKMPEGFKPGEMPEGMPEMGELPAAEAIEIEVSESTNITVDGEKGSISDLEVGDFIQITMDEDIVAEITVGMEPKRQPK